MRSRKIWFYTCLFGTAAIAAAILIVLQSITTYTSDDYYYAVFWRGGLTNFLSRNVGHFFERNGRVLVHLLAETFLALGMRVYAVCNTVMLGGILLLFVRYQTGEASSVMAWAVSAAAFFIGLLFVDYRVMKSWILCVADACNYIFPLFMLGLLLFCLKRAEEKGRGRRFPLFVCAFLAGATTEQGGVIAITLLFSQALRNRIREKHPNTLTVRSALCVLLGLLTVFASPATRQRAGAEFSVGGFLFGFVQYASSIAAPGMSLNIIALLCLLMGLMPITGKVPKPLLAGLPLGVFLFSGYFLPPGLVWNTAAGVLIFVYMFIAAVILLLRSPYGGSAAMLLAGLCSAGMVMFTSSVSVRVTTPFMLLMLLCGIFFLTELCLPMLARNERLFLPGILGAVAALTLAIALQSPAISGMWTNYQILRQNELAVETARTTHELRYTDYVSPYCLTDLFSDPYISEGYLSYYGLGEDCVASHYQEDRTVLLSGTEEAAVSYNGRLYVPLRAAVESRQGDLRWITDNYIWFRFDEPAIIHMPYLYTGHGTFDASRDVIFYNGKTYLSTDILQAACHLDIVSAD